MSKVILTDITFLEISHVRTALNALKRDHEPPPYEVRIGPGVKLGPGVDRYLEDNRVVRIKLV